MILCNTTLCYIILSILFYHFTCVHIQVLIETHAVNKWMVSKIQQAMHCCMKSTSYVDVNHAICDREIRSLEQVYIWEFAPWPSRLSNQKRSDGPVFTDVYAALTFSFKLSIPSTGPLILWGLPPQLVSEPPSHHSSLQISRTCSFELQGVARAELRQWNSFLLQEPATQFSYCLLGGTGANILVKWLQRAEWKMSWSFQHFLSQSFFLCLFQAQPFEQVLVAVLLCSKRRKQLSWTLCREQKKVIWTRVRRLGISFSSARWQFPLSEFTWRGKGCLEFSQEQLRDRWGEVGLASLHRLLCLGWVSMAPK